MRILLVLLVACSGPHKPSDELEVTTKPGENQQVLLGYPYNEAGIEAMRRGQYAEATRKFGTAVATVPEPAYFFNLCLSLYYEGRHDDALKACTAVDASNPRIKKKAERWIERIRSQH